MSLEIIQYDYYKPKKSISYNHQFYYDVFNLTDFTICGDNVAVSKYYLNPVMQKINQGYGYDSLFDLNGGLPNIKFESDNSIATLANSFYTSKHKWNNPNYISGNLVVSSAPTFFGVSGENSDFVKVYGVNPTYFTIYNTHYSKFNFESIEYEKNGSVLFFNANHIHTTGLTLNWETNDLLSANNQIFYGGISQTNQIELNSFVVNERIDFNLGFTSTFGQNLSTFIYSGCPYDSGNIYQWYFAYGKVCTKGLDYSLIVAEQYIPTGTAGMNTVKKTLHASNFSNTFHKDNLIHINCPVDKPIGSVEFDYVFYKQNCSGLYDFIPKGYIHQSGTQNVTSTLFTIPTPVRRDAYRTVGPKVISTTIYGEKTPFSSGIIRLHAASSILDFQNILSPLSPYGVECKGNHLLDMLVYVKGNLDSTNLYNAIDFEDFVFDNVELKLDVRNNKVSNKLYSHGELGSSGNIVWSDNHGPSRIKYNTIIAGSSEIGYTTSNLLGEIYRISYNETNKNIIFTGNLVNEFEPVTYLNVLQPSGSYNYDVSGNPISSNLNMIPIGQFVSNYTYPTGYITSRLNRQSLSYGMSKTSNLVCGEPVFVASSILYATGETMSNIPSKMTGFGYIPAIIYTTGAN